MAQGFERGPKFLRLLSLGGPSNYNNDGERLYSALLKVFYEFWGFCINGDNDLTGAMGFPTGSFHSFGTEFESGSLLISGSDGMTVAGTPYFSSSAADFTTLTGSSPDSNLFNKLLVTWKSGSTSTDDSIYPIKSVLASGVLWIDTNTGGTPWTGSVDTNRPRFTDRTDINYRIIDLQDTVNTVAAVSGDYMVMQYDGAPDINPGQAKSQLRFGLRPSSIAWRMSPSGSWNGSDFGPDGGVEYFPSLADSQNSGEWGGLSSGATEVGFSLIAARGFFFFWLSGQHSTAGGNTPAAYIHSEIPERLYPANIDPNPITSMGAYSTSLDIDSTVHGYAGGWYIHDVNERSRRHRTIVKSPTNDHFDTAFTSDRLDTPAARMRNSTYDVHTDRIWMTEGLLYLGGIPGYFTLARCRLRSVRFISKIVPDNSLIGTDPGNQWYHIFRSILLPWDGAILPRPLDILGRI